MRATLTFVRPSPLRSTFAELRTDGVTRVCNLRSPLLFAISLHGNSVAFKMNRNHSQNLHKMV